MGPNDKSSSSISKSKALRHKPEVGAVWGNSPRTDLYGGRPVTGVPTVNFVLNSDYFSVIVSRGDHVPRSARKKSSIGIYHIVIRGINKQRIFEDDEDKRKGRNYRHSIS